MHRRDSWLLLILMVLSLFVFLPGIRWGLPFRKVDVFLFGDHAVWTGEQILQLAGPTEDASRGADVASHGPADRRSVVVANATDEERARIVRRYRLMSYQPDEWVTLKSLSEMKPGRGNFDPKLYQYGGLWVYPVGALLKAASMVHLIQLRADPAYYLDHPEEFGAFYIVARLYSVAWAVAGVMAVYIIVRRFVGQSLFPALAALCYVFMPIVVNMAHEAKPHLAGAVLMLLAVLAASRFVESGTRRAALGAGALCGMALGMVLSSLPIFLILPAMVLLRRSTGRQKLAMGCTSLIMGTGVYLLTNPYVPFNLIFHREIILSNIRNTQSMFPEHLTISGLGNTLYLLATGASPVLALVGTIGALALGGRAIRERANNHPGALRRRATGLLLAVPAMCVLLQSTIFATGKPAEFARFMVLADLFLLIEGTVALATFFPSARRCRLAVAFVLVVSTAIPGLLYVKGFVRDTRSSKSRLLEAAQLRQLALTAQPTLAVRSDPAPYCLPPVDVFKWKIVLLPPDHNARLSDGNADVSLEVMDVPFGRHRLNWLQPWITTPISWADKPMEIRAKPRMPQ